MLRTFLTIATVALSAASVTAAETEARLVNALRIHAGLNALAAEPTLANAAARHAAYLDRHRKPGASGQGISAHAQLADREGFSGETPGERALASGYPHDLVLENVSMGYQDADGAIDGLMAAIYHRLAFLDLGVDQLGVAVGEASRVFLLGRSDVAGMCREPPSTALFQTPVDCLGTAMRRSHYQALCQNLPSASTFRPPHPVSCPDGTRLDAAFMRRICAVPPPEARFDGAGRYFLPCGDSLRIDADWLLGVCAGSVPGARLAGDGSYYEICEPPRKVRADWFEGYCAHLPDEALYLDSLRFQRPCAQPHEIRVEYLQQLRDQRLAAAPAVVAWPPDGAADIPPAFFHEEPDPLPDLAVSGYPVSLQFNPHDAGVVELASFRLLELAADGENVEVEGRVLDRSSDPHGILTGHQFAFFPLQRLRWATTYRVIARVSVDGAEQRFDWQFETRGSDRQIVTVREDGQRIPVVSGRLLWLYLPPTDALPLTAMSTRIEHRQTTQVAVSAVDANTLAVSVEAPVCDRVRLRFDDGRSVILIPDTCAG